jgi:hypothetical protein
MGTGFDLSAASRWLPAAAAAWAAGPVLLR